MKKIKGFTLVECIVALAVLGFTSLLLCQAYTNLLKVSTINNTMYTSVAQQMTNAEEASGDNGNAAVIISGSKIVSDKYSSTEGRDFVIQRVAIKQDATTSKFDVERDAANQPKVYDSGKEKYLLNVNVYCVKPYRNNMMVEDSDVADDGTSLRFIYFHR